MEKNMIYKLIMGFCMFALTAETIAFLVDHTSIGIWDIPIWPIFALLAISAGYNATED
jgi:hypothetical protein